MTIVNKQALRPGEIRLDLIPIDWPLTPLGENKNPYVGSWHSKPFSVKEIEQELTTGHCKAIGLISGPCFNEPFGLVWVDVDGPTVYKVIEEVSGLSVANALPPTLTIMSGKVGRERKLYKVSRDKQLHFVRNKYTWHAEGLGEKLEILWGRHQGVLMGLHPETDGYYTPEGQGFEWVNEIPEFPDWILNGIITKNVKQGVPAIETTRYVGASFAVQATITLDRDMQLAKEAAWSLPIKLIDDYDIWISTGQIFHSLDESMLEEWENWSKQSDKYREGECHRKWQSFNKGGGRNIGSLLLTAKENGWKQPSNAPELMVNDEMFEHVTKQLTKIEEDLEMPQEVLDAATQELIVKPKKTGRPPKKNAKVPTITETLEVEDERTTRNSSASEITELLLSMYKGGLLFSQSHNQFLMYQGDKSGVWSPVGKTEMLGDIRNKLQRLSDQLPKGFTHNFMLDVYAQLQSVLGFNDWDPSSTYLLFKNGVLDIETRELLPFDKELYITQQMPYEYDRYAKCEDIVTWLKFTQSGSWQRVQVLRAWLRATLLGKYELQKFVELVGPGKSGKSTYANLAVALIGKANCYSTDFENLEKNRFEAAFCFGKKLLLFQDADRWGGSVSKLKAITGGDWIRSERKYQSDNIEPFQYTGVVLITANEAIQSTDYTSGLSRRRLTIPFERPFTGGPNEQKTLIGFDAKGRPLGEFAPLLPGLVNWLLDMSEEEMRSLLLETSANSKFFAKHESEQALKSNPILDWLDHCVVYDIGVRSAIGFLQPTAPGESRYYKHSTEWLYASYVEFCRSCGVGNVGRSRFEGLLLDICRHQLKLKVFGKKETNGFKLFNLTIREGKPKYEGWPSIVTVAANKTEYKEFYGVDLENDNEIIKDPDVTNDD